MRLKIVTVIVIMFFSFGWMGQCRPGNGTRSNPEAEEQALKSAEAWLKLLDEGKYDDCWDQGAGYFKKAVSKEKLNESLTAARKPLGTLISRNVKSKTYATSLPGAPDGEYVVIQFDTSFENKKVAVETVTPMKDKDGAWRLSGYYIK